MFHITKEVRDLKQPVMRNSTMLIPFGQAKISSFNINIPSRFGAYLSSILLALLLYTYTNYSKI